MATSNSSSANTAAQTTTADAPSGGLGLDADFDTRWAAWQARGRAHERASRTKFIIVAPLVAAAVGFAAYLLSSQ
jgi:hypothetical protein